MGSIEEVFGAMAQGAVIPYLGPGVLAASPGSDGIPGSPVQLVDRLTTKASVPHKIRNNLTAAAQFIENFKHRKTLVKAMMEAYSANVSPGEIYRCIAAIPQLPLVVSAWYDNLAMLALSGRDNWGMVQGVSQTEHFGVWVHYFDQDGARVEEDQAKKWSTLLYQPFGSISPAANFLVSDTDFVEVLTEIDIQTPIPSIVQNVRHGRHFLFLGCRFSNQLDRLFARQIMKRSSNKHWALIEGELTRNEARFLVEQNIQRIDMSLAEFMTQFGKSDTLPLAAAV